MNPVTLKIPLAGKTVADYAFLIPFQSSFVTMHPVRAYLGLRVVVRFGPTIIVTAVHC